MLAFSLLLFFSFSQPATKSLAQALQEYKAADIFYEEALRINEKGPGADQREAQYNQTALKRFTQIEKSLPQGNHAFDSLHFFVALKMGQLAHYFDSLSVAAAYYEKAIALKKFLPQLADSFAFKAYVLCGNIYFVQNRLDEATAAFGKAEAIQDRASRKIMESERLYNALGALHFQAGNYLQAGNYFREAAETLERGRPYYTDFLVNYSINAAIALFKLEQFDSAAASLQRLLPYRIHLNEIHNNLGLIYYRKGQYNEALKEYGQVHYNNRLDIGVQNDRANAWLALDQYDSAASCLNAAEALNASYNGSQLSADHGLTFKIHGDLLSRQDRPEEALNLYQQALHQFYPAFSGSSPDVNPEKFSGVFSYINLFNTLAAKAVAFYRLYEHHHDLAYARSALATYTSAFALIDYIVRSYDSDEARLFLKRTSYDIHTRPIDLAFQLYSKTGDAAFLEKAYQMDQQNKASVLAFNVQRNQISDLSSGSRQREQKLKMEITRLSLMSMNAADSASVASAGRRISELEIQLGRVQDSTSSAYPIAVSIPDIRTLQAKIISRGTLLLSYHLSEAALTVFTVTHDRFNGYQIPLYSDFRKDLHNFVRSLHENPDRMVPDTLVQRLSAVLLGNFIPEQEKRVIIIPDDELNYLPFEALIHNGNYLIEEHSIQYQFSTALLKTENTDFRNFSTAAFAPFAHQRISAGGLVFPELPSSFDEIHALEGSRYVNNDASKQAFLDHFDEHEILHLATHAVAGDSSGSPSFIVFAPASSSSKGAYLLYAREIYDLTLRKTRLVILSACETGYGKLVRGEGVMSLSRAFAYAGCPDIITSLWKADDEATAFLTKKIHAYLKKGLPVDVALQKAKLDYLNSANIHPRKKLPSYWAHLVFIGNHQTSPSAFPWIWVCVLICGVLIFLYGIRKKLRSH
ncbi:MAG TPA: CHAT domain-containing tetratricopeptide repeat protein [Flavisolibacter sp.]|nr:CHAT domain-containing tetratricopeptide repeat protein [Flavisolibacter sp.]